MDTREFRNCLGKFATGVTVVTSKLDNQNLVGITVNSFTSVSLDPPLVLFCLDKKAQSFDAFGLSSCFVFNILSENQMEISNRFASQGVDKFFGAKFKMNENGIPVLDGCLANIHCRMHAVYDGGDHQIIVGNVIMIEQSEEEDLKPLLYFKGNYQSLK